MVEKFRGLSRFYGRLSQFERAVITDHSDAIKVLLVPLLDHYRILEAMHERREQGRLDELHRLLFSYEFPGLWRATIGPPFRYRVVEGGLPNWIRRLRTQVNNVAKDLEKMGFPSNMQEDLQDLQNFVLGESLDLRPLADIGFSSNDLEWMASTIREGLDANRHLSLVREKGVIAILRGGSVALDTLWRAYIEELRAEGFLQGGISPINPGSKQLFGRLLIVGGATFLIVHDILQSNHTTVATAAIAIGTLLK